MEEKINKEEHSKSLRCTIWEMLKFLVQSKILPGILLIIMWLISCVGYNNYLMVYYMTFEQWQQIIVIKPDIFYVLVVVHVAMLMLIIWISGTAGVISMFIPRRNLNGNSRGVFAISVVIGTFIVIIWVIGIQLYFGDPYILLKSLIDSKI